jgi:8-oxo-dGTP pyrophosphatase MutT (NUDIX family)
MRARGPWPAAENGCPTAAGSLVATDGGSIPASKRLAVQCAAIPYCRAELEEPRILLITSKRTRRWVLPKGWPKAGETLAAAAAREAFEEAGVLGQALCEESVGEYTYDKWIGGGLVACRVAVFALPVAGIARSWPERGQRALRWCSPEQAARLVREPRLGALFAQFDPPPSAEPTEQLRFSSAPD